MKLSQSLLRKLIRETIEEQASVPGHWDPTAGEPLSDEDKDKLGTPSGLGSSMNEIGQDEFNDPKIQKMLVMLQADPELFQQKLNSIYDNARKGKISKKKFVNFFQKMFQNK